MLPNHAPLVIAEQFGTLESLYPGRIDLALGRAPGSDQATARALRRHLGSSGDTFPDDLVELISYFQPAEPGQRIQAVPGAGLSVPLYLLGSSDFSARVSAELGLPFGFASHFAPEYLRVALELYRNNFKPSHQLQQPYAIVGIGAYCATSDADARHLFTSAQQQILTLIRGRPGRLPPPVDSMDELWSEAEQVALAQRARYTMVGSPDSVRQRLKEIIAETGCDELIIVSQIYEHSARLRSYELLSEILKTLS